MLRISAGQSADLHQSFVLLEGDLSLQVPAACLDKDSEQLPAFLLDPAALAGALAPLEEGEQATADLSAPCVMLGTADVLDGGRRVLQQVGQQLYTPQHASLMVKPAEGTVRQSATSVQSQKQPLPEAVSWTAVAGSVGATLLVLGPYSGPEGGEPDVAPTTLQPRAPHL